MSGSAKLSSTCFASVVPSEAIALIHSTAAPCSAVALFLLRSRSSVRASLHRLCPSAGITSRNSKPWRVVAASTSRIRRDPSRGLIKKRQNAQASPQQVSLLLVVGSASRGVFDNWLSRSNAALLPIERRRTKVPPAHQHGPIHPIWRAKRRLLDEIARITGIKYREDHANFFRSKIEWSSVVARLAVFNHRRNCVSDSIGGTTATVLVKSCGLPSSVAAQIAA